jgi:hypothetical protein
MDPPPPSRKEHRPRGHDFGQVQGMNSQNENPNKALHPYGAHGAPRVNADVGSEYIGIRAINGPSTTVKTKSIDRAETIWESEARNSQ